MHTLPGRTVTGEEREVVVGGGAAGQKDGRGGGFDEQNIFPQDVPNRFVQLGANRNTAPLPLPHPLHDHVRRGLHVPQLCGDGTHTHGVTARPTKDVAPCRTL